MFEETKIHIYKALLKKNVHLQKAFFMIFKPFFCCVLLFVLATTKTVIAQDSISSHYSDSINKKLIQPPYLKTGDTVAIVAP